jgi:hypothetical protein
MTGRNGTMPASNQKVEGSNPSGPTFLYHLYNTFIMKFQREYYYSFVGIIAVFVVYLLPSFVNTLILHLLISTFSILLGGIMVVLGFWGSDFAFAMALKELDQSKEKGEVRGKKNKVCVPFMKNYTPLEWWNINWFITLMGVLLVALGSVLLGIVAGVYIF